MIYEFKKINNEKIITICSLLCIILSIILPLFFINGYEAYDYSSGKEESINGFKGLNYKKEQVKKVDRKIDQRFIKSVLEYSNQFSSTNDLDYIKTEQKFPGVYYFLKNAYSPYGEEASFSIRDINPNKSLTDARKTKIKSKMYATGKSRYSVEEEIKILSFIENNDNTMKYDFVDQWPIIIKSLIFSYYSIIILVVIMSSRLFSIEKNTNMDKIIIESNTKMSHKITTNKLKMFYGYIFFIYLLCNLIILSIVIIFVGTNGFESSIQIIPDLFTSIYPWSIGEMLAKYILEAFVCICAIGGVSILINLVTKNDISTIILTIFFCAFPFLLKLALMGSNSIGIKIVQSFPISGVNILNYIGELDIYHLGNKVILPYYVTFGSSLLLALISNLLVMKKSKLV